MRIQCTAACVCVYLCALVSSCTCVCLIQFVCMRMGVRPGPAK